MTEESEKSENRVALITGGSGFVGRALQLHLEAHTSWSVWSPSRDPTAQNAASGRHLDVRDIASVSEILQQARPDYIFHLAAATPPAESSVLLETNVLGSAALLDSVLIQCPHARVLVVGSDAQYGPQDDSRMPTDEGAPMRPVNVYGRSKVLQEKVAMAYHAMYGLKVICARPFNIFGPGQSDRYVLGALARKVALAEQYAGSSEIPLTNPEATRDFTDVRDVARAYLAIILQGASGDIYNVGSGRALAVRDLAEALARMASRPVTFRPDERVERTGQVIRTLCDATKLERLTGWRPVLTPEQTVADTLEYWRGRLGAGPDPSRSAGGTPRRR